LTPKAFGAGRRLKRSRRDDESLTFSILIDFTALTVTSVVRHYRCFFTISQQNPKKCNFFKKDFEVKSAMNEGCEGELLMALGYSKA